MRVIFLDFDGVLNTTGHAPILPPAPLTPMHGSIEWLAYQLEPDLCARLSRLVERADARVVLSTTWRNAFPLPRLWELMGRVGLPVPIGATPMLPGGRRDREILAWCDAAGVDNFVALDDDPMDSIAATGRLVQTDPWIGLADEDVEAALRVLVPCTE